MRARARAKSLRAGVRAQALSDFVNVWRFDVIFERFLNSNNLLHFLYFFSLSLSKEGRKVMEFHGKLKTEIILASEAVYTLKILQPVHY
jgi:hypothetical protein